MPIKPDATYPVSIVLIGFVVAMIMVLWLKIKVLHCTQNEHQLLSERNPTCNYPRMVGKKNAINRIGIVLGVFVVAFIMVKDNCTQDELQILWAFNAATCNCPRYGWKNESNISSKHYFRTL